ncbi:cysteine hydrolase [Bradyrhizobium canariense]|uniref:cysteine hydrolase family protein n=1 Tax=Bradyrhizobium canariense TaxID=255045 RepID=UPI001C663D89|nr:isochorismatase family cysteine hydrolase [Bradyrhizobium canariense]MBW5437974.1 cysteine hydrolase [Bradyrhizobium canariense]
MTIPPIDAPHGAYRERPIELAKTALLSVDMQNAEFNHDMLLRSRVAGSDLAHKNDFFERMAAVVIPNQVRLQRAARTAGIEVVFTVIESRTQDGRDRSLDHKISGIHVPKGSGDAQVIDAVKPEGDEIIIPKTSSSVFNSTNIEYVFRNLGVEYLIVYGVITDQCVESAVRDAADKGFLVTQIEDCCAADTSLNHVRSIESMRGHYCRTRTTDQMIAEIDQLAKRGLDPRKISR